MFYFLQELSVTLLKNEPAFPSLKSNFLTCYSRLFTKIFFPHLGKWDANVMTLPNQLAPKQITNLQNTTV